VCHAINLGYRDPASIDPAVWQGAAEADTLVVPRAGELLYRLGPPARPTEGPAGDSQKAPRPAGAGWGEGVRSA
jgi:hypothetical protein